MIGQIGCLGKASWRIGLVSALLYTAGISLGAALVGAALGLLGYSVRWTFYLGPNSHSPGLLFAVALVALIGGLRDLGFLRLSLPQPFKQVPYYWLHVFGPRKTSFLWGFSIGLAFNTMIQYSLYYVLAIWVALMGQPLLGAAALALYGFTQGTLLVLETLAVSTGACGPGGLFGIERSNLLARLSGAFLLACAVLLATHSGVYPAVFR
jgi:hypothetical protein